MRTNSISNILTFALVLTACASCETQPHRMEMTFEVVGKNAATKAVAITDADNIKNFFICANTKDPNEQRSGLADGFNYCDYAIGMRMGNDWRITPPIYWPLNTETKLNLYAISPAGSVNINNFKNLTEGVVLDYTVPENYGQEDLLFAVKGEVTQSTDGKVELNFRHALALLRISARNLTPLPVITITKVEIYGLHNSGKLNLSATTLKWEATDNKQTKTDKDTFQLSYTCQLPEGGFRLFRVEAKDQQNPNTYTKLYNPQEGLFLLPQTIPQGHAAYVRITYLDENNISKTIEVNYPVKEEAQTIGIGEVVTATLDIGKDNNWGLNITFNGWEKRSTYIINDKLGVDINP